MTVYTAAGGNIFFIKQSFKQTIYILFWSLKVRQTIVLIRAGDWKECWGTVENVGYEQNVLWMGWVYEGKKEIIIKSEI